MKKIFLLLVMAMLFTACHKDDDSEEDVTPERTILVYVAGDNNLSNYADLDLKEMKTASLKLGNRQRLIVYVDQADNNTPPKNPSPPTLLCWKRLFAICARTIRQSRTDWYSGGTARDGYSAMTI